MTFPATQNQIGALITQYNVLTGAASGEMNNVAPSAAGQVLTSNGVSAQPSFQALPVTPIPFTTVTTATEALVASNTYYTTYAGLCVMTLPTIAAAGTIIEVLAGPSGNTFQIAQNANQFIYYGSQSGVSVVTTTGVTGYLQSVSPNTTVTLKCIVANLEWIVTSNVVNLTGN